MPNWQDLKKKAMDAVNNAAEQVDYQLSLTKLRRGLDQAQKELDIQFQHFGKLVYEAMQRQDPVDWEEESIAAAKKQVETSQNQLDEARAQLNAELAKSSGGLVCPSCQAPLSATSKFCPACGQPVV